MRLIRRIYNWLLMTASVFLFISVTLAACNAFMRYGLNHGLVWAEEMVTYLIVIAVFLSQPWLEINGSQLKINILDDKLKNVKLQKALFIFRKVFTVGVIALLIRYGVFVAHRAYGVHAVTFVLQIPRYVLYATATVTLCLVVLGLLFAIYEKGVKKYD